MLRTLFKWLHMFIKALASFNPSKLTGIIESDETFYQNHLKIKEKASENHVKGVVEKSNKFNQ